MVDPATQCSVLESTTGCWGRRCKGNRRYKRKMHICMYTPKGSHTQDHLCYLCLVCVMLSRLFIAALWPPAGKAMTSWLSFVMFICVLSLSHLVSWVMCGAVLQHVLK